MAGPVKTEIPPSSMERADQSPNNCPNEPSIGDASSQGDPNRPRKQKTESRLSRVSAAPPRQSSLFRTGSAERGDPSGLTALNSWTDGPGAVRLSKMSFDPSPPETAVPGKSTKFRSYRSGVYFREYRISSSCHHRKPQQ
jgi:hypothetical protein